MVMFVAQRRAFRAGLLLASLAVPAVAQTSQEAADWLVSLKATLDYKAPTAATVPEGRTLSFNRPDEAAIKAEDFAKLKPLLKLGNLNLYPFATDAIVAEAVKAAPRLTEVGIHYSPSRPIRSD